ncbi:hypothetical protein M8818_007708 [Zalaria obscura]|uniref:Uncharacterized protein n=1 Tax=Zalaria obscura TaxID=2024903 RepID=A0ACC3S2N7_9PEZI
MKSVVYVLCVIGDISEISVGLQCLPGRCRHCPRPHDGGACECGIRLGHFLAFLPPTSFETITNNSIPILDAA